MPSHSLVQSNMHEGEPKLSEGKGLKRHEKSSTSKLDLLSTPLHIKKIERS